MFTSRKHQALLGFFAALLLVPTTYADVLVVIDGIEGESMATGFPGRPIEALSFDWGMSRAEADTGITATRYSGAVNIQALTFTHHVDKATPKLMEYCATGRSLPNAIVAVQRTGPDGRPLNFFVIELKDVLIDSVGLSGSDQEGPLVEQVSLRFGSYKVTYTETGAKGEKTGTVETSYNLETAKM